MLDGVVGQRHTPTFLHPGKPPVPILQEAVWVTIPVWTDAGSSATASIRSRTFHPVTSRYPSPRAVYEFILIRTNASGIRVRNVSAGAQSQWDRRTPLINMAVKSLSVRVFRVLTASLVKFFSHPRRKRLP